MTTTQMVDEDQYDPFEAFDQAQGIGRIENPYPRLAELRREAPIHRTSMWKMFELGRPSGDVYNDAPFYSALSYKAVTQVLKDSSRFSSRIYAEAMGPVMGHSLLEMDGPEHGTYRTSDQRFIMLNMLQADRYWPGFCRAVGREDLLEDPQYADFEQRSQHRDTLFAVIREAFASHPLDHWREQLTKHDCVWSAVQTPSEAANDPQSVANGYLAQHPTNPRGRVVASPVQYNGGTLELKRGAPELGQHTEEVLQELGLDWGEIGRLKEQGVVT